MEWLKTATIRSNPDWHNHIALCEDQQLGDHLAVVSGSLMPGANTSHPNPPFVCYSILQQDIDLNGDISYRWIHTCFTVIDAAIVASYNLELYEATMKKKRKELAAEAPDRQKKLIEDIELDMEPEEDLGTIGMREAMEVAKEKKIPDA